MELTHAQISRYDSDGFLVVPSVFGGNELVELRQLADRLLDVCGPLIRQNPRVNLEDTPDTEAPVIRKIEPIVDLLPEFDTLSRDPRFTGIASQLLQCSEVQLFEDKLNYKPARLGSAFPLHQDNAYWTEFSDRLVTVILYIDDAIEENGCVHFVPGSHKQGLLPTMGGNEPYIAPTGNPAQTTGAPGQAGSLVVFSGYTIHHSVPNRSPNPRTSILFTYHPAEEGDGYAVYSGKRAAQCREWLANYRTLIIRKIAAKYF